MDYDCKIPEEAVIEKRARLWAELEAAIILNELGKEKNERHWNSEKRNLTLINAKEDRGAITENTG